MPPADSGGEPTPPVGTDPEDAATGEADAAPDRPDTGGPCTSESCGGELCCVSVVSSQRACVASCSGPTQFALRCDDSSDCDEGESCCFETGASLTAECRSSCNTVVLCDPQNPTCPFPQSCEARVFGLGRCQ